MRKFLATALAGVMLATSAIAVAPAAEARGWHHDRGYNNGYSGGYRGGYRHHNNNAGAAIAGLALGAIIGGVIVSNNNNGYYSNYNNGYYRDSYRRSYYDNGHDARCFQQYGRSYDPSSSTFVGRDGGLYYCRL